MTEELLKQRLRDLANELKDDPIVDHRHVEAILWAISALLGLGMIQVLSPIVAKILTREFEYAKEQIESN